MPDNKPNTAIKIAGSQAARMEGEALAVEQQAIPAHIQQELYDPLTARKARLAMIENPDPIQEGAANLANMIVGSTSALGTMAFAGMMVATKRHLTKGEAIEAAKSIVEELNDVGFDEKAVAQKVRSVTNRYGNEVGDALDALVKYARGVGEERINLKQAGNNLSKIKESLEQTYHNGNFTPEFKADTIAQSIKDTSGTIGGHIYTMANAIKDSGHKTVLPEALDRIKDNVPGGLTTVVAGIALTVGLASTIAAHRNNRNIQAIEAMSLREEISNMERNQTGASPLTFVQRLQQEEANNQAVESGRFN